MARPVERAVVAGAAAAALTGLADLTGSSQLSRAHDDRHPLRTTTRREAFEHPDRQHRRRVDRRTREVAVSALAARARDRSPALRGRKGDRLRLQFPEPPANPSQDLALYDAIGAAGGATLAISQSDKWPHRRARRRCEPGRGPRACGGRQSHHHRRGWITRFPRAVSGLESLAVVAAQRVTHKPLPGSAFTAAATGSTFAAGPTFAAVLPGDVRGRVPASLVRGQDRHRGRHGAKSSRPSLDAHQRCRSHVRPRGSGERDLDRRARQPTPGRARLADRARNPARRPGCSPGGSQNRRRQGGAGRHRRRHLLRRGGATRIQCGNRHQCVLAAPGLRPGHCRDARCELFQRKLDRHLLGMDGASPHRATARRTARNHHAARAGGRIARPRHGAAHPPHRLPMRAAGPAGRVRRGSGTHAPPRQRTPRRRQDRHPRSHPAEASRPGRRRVGDHEIAHDQGRGHPCGLDLAADPDGRDDRADSPRALGWHGLSGRIDGRRDPPRRPHLRGLRRLRRARLQASVQGAMGSFRGDP